MVLKMASLGGPVIQVGYVDRPLSKEDYDLIEKLYQIMQDVIGQNVNIKELTEQTAERLNEIYDRVKMPLIVFGKINSKGKTAIPYYKPIPTLRGISSESVLSLVNYSFVVEKLEESIDKIDDLLDEIYAVLFLIEGHNKLIKDYLCKSASISKVVGGYFGSNEGIQLYTATVFSDMFYMAKFKKGTPAEKVVEEVEKMLPILMKELNKEKIIESIRDFSQKAKSKEIGIIIHGSWESPDLIAIDSFSLTDLKEDEKTTELNKVFDILSPEWKEVIKKLVDFYWLLFPTLKKYRDELLKYCKEYSEQRLMWN